MVGPVVLLQLPVPYTTALKVTGDIPLGAAALLCHSQVSESGRFLILQREARRFGDAALLEHITNISPSVLCLTVTVWNIERSFHLAKRVREMLPRTSVWIGGPEVVLSSPLIAEENAPFDLAVEGEGELIFEALIRGDLPWTGSLSAGKKLLPSLATLHDPYLRSLVHPESDLVVFTEFGRGCRYKCTYCRYQGGRGANYATRPKEQIPELFAWARDNNIKEIYLLDPSLEQRPGLEDFLQFIAANNSEPCIPLVVELRAESLDERLAELLFDAGIRRVETGLQTTNRTALRKINRPCDTAKFLKGIECLEQRGIDVKIDIMTGLPGDSEQGYRRTLRFLSDNEKAGKIQIFRTQVLPGTALWQTAAALGIDFQPKPPYHVLSTPTWPAERLEQDLALAEKELELSFSLEDAPVLSSKCHSNQPYSRAVHDGTPIYYHVSFDLDTVRGREALQNERFTDAAAAFVLELKCRRPAEHMTAALEAVDEMLRKNPYCTVFVCLAIKAGEPLDIFDRIDEIFGRHRISGYAESMYSAMSAFKHPTRRLLCRLSLDDVKSVHGDWLKNLREECSVVWCKSCMDIESACRNIEFFDKECIAGEDYLFIDLDVRAELERLAFRELSKTASIPESILLPGLKTHWSWRNFLDRNTGCDW